MSFWILKFVQLSTSIDVVPVRDKDLLSVPTWNQVQSSSSSPPCDFLFYGRGDFMAITYLVLWIRSRIEESSWKWPCSTILSASSMTRNLRWCNSHTCFSPWNPQWHTDLMAGHRVLHALIHWLIDWLTDRLTLDNDFIRLIYMYIYRGAFSSL